MSEVVLIVVSHDALCEVLWEDPDLCEQSDYVVQNQEKRLRVILVAVQEKQWS